MTVAAQTPTISYNENGVTTSFAVPFRYDSPADLRASRRAADGTVTALVQGVDFTATPGPTNAGGTLTVTAAAAVGTVLTISRSTARVQTADYINNGAFEAESHERALDQAMMVNQEQDQELARAVKAPLGEVLSPLPWAAQRAGRFLAFDLDGRPIAAEGTSSGDAAVTAFVGSGTGAVARTVESKLRETVSVMDLGAVGDGTVHPVAEWIIPGARGRYASLAALQVDYPHVTAATDTIDWAAIQAALDSSRVVSLGQGKDYRVGNTINVRQSGAVLEGYPDTVIRLDVAATNPGGLPRWLSPVITVWQSAAEAKLVGFTVDHRGQDFPLFPATVRRPGFLGTGGGDVYGCAVLFMGPKGSISGLTVLNGWDNGIGVGDFNETTGAQISGPSGVRVQDCLTFNCGTGKHSWGPYPGGFYYQGCGVNFLTATEFNCVNCYDVGSYNAFWADINGSARGHFVNCVSHFCAGNLIASDAAAGSNQPWNTGGFGGTITYTGSGWDKTPGGLAFYSGSYGVHFTNCTAYQPAMYGFVCDYYSSANVLTSCRVVNSGLEAFVFAGGGGASKGPHTCVAPVIEGAGLRAGEVAASGSVCQPRSAILVTGMQETASGLNVDGIVNIVSPVINHGQRYPDAPFATAKYDYAIRARTRNGRNAFVNVSYQAASIEAGTAGTFLADSGSFLTRNEMGQGQNIIASSSGSASVAVQSGSNPAVVLFQEASGAATLQNFGGALVLAGTDVRLAGLPTSAAGLASGALWRDAGAGNVVKAVP